MVNWAQTVIFFCFEAVATRVTMTSTYVYNANLPVIRVFKNFQSACEHFS